MKLDQAKIMIVGCGSLGSALIKGWIAKRLGNCNYTVITPHENATEALRITGVSINWYPSVNQVPSSYTPDIIVFAVKPNVLSSILSDYKKYVNETITLISVAAGKKMSFYQKQLGKNAAIVRVMPNLPVAYNKGICVGMPNEFVNKHQLATTNFLFKAVGKVVWLEDEKYFDAVTAISGCGPAYLFLLTECLAKAGQEVGLSKKVAEELARQTMIGASELLDHADETPAILKQRVASPGGATEAALKVLDNPADGMSQAITRAIKVATERSRELSA